MKNICEICKKDNDTKPYYFEHGKMVDVRIEERLDDISEIVLCNKCVQCDSCKNKGEICFYTLINDRPWPNKTEGCHLCLLLCKECKRIECCGICGSYCGDLCRYCRADFF